MDKEYAMEHGLIIRNKYIHRQSEEDIEKMKQYKEFEKLFV